MGKFVRTFLCAVMLAAAFSCAPRDRYITITGFAQGGTYAVKLNLNGRDGMIQAAVRLGCHAAELDAHDDRLAALVAYAQNIGLAFQVVDDVLDATQSAEIMGKSVGSDARDKKTTFMTFYDVQGAKDYAAGLTARAIDAVKDIEGSEGLVALANYLIERNY